MYIHNTAYVKRRVVSRTKMDDNAISGGGKKGGSEMPCDYKTYSPMWKVIRAKIISRSEGRCELCNAENYKPHWKTGSKVVLTIHHIDYDKTNDKDYNLLALCQRCHNKLDMPLRIKNRKAAKR